LRGEARAATERRRLARELHDSVSQALFAAAATADALPRLWELDPTQGRRALADLGRLTGGAQAEMRTLLVELRPEALTRAPLHDLLRSLLSAAAAKTGASVASRLEPVPVLPSDAQVALYRIAQEALNNVVKHAAAGRVTVRLQAMTGPAAGEGSTPDTPDTPGALLLEVTDDGRGFDPERVPGGGLGLGSMRERAESIGASLRLDSRPGGGTVVAVSWPGPGGDRAADLSPEPAVPVSAAAAAVGGPQEEAR
jgi:signal transduction histidine kinase